MNQINTTGCTVMVAAGAAVVLGLHANLSLCADAPPPPGPPLAPAPAGHYQLDKSHASLQLRVSHMGFSTYTTSAALTRN